MENLNKFSVLYGALRRAVIGMARYLLLPSLNLGEAFSQSVAPILQAYAEQANDVIEKFFSGKTPSPHFLLAGMTDYPQWVYQDRVSPVFREGFRYFLMTLERMGDTLASMQYFASQKIAEDLLIEFQPVIKIYQENNAQLFALVQGYLATGKVGTITADYTEDVERLEAIFQRQVPVPLELLDMKKEYLSLAGFSRDLKDLRMLLLQLAATLQE